MEFREQSWGETRDESHYSAYRLLLNLLPVSTVLHFHFPKRLIPPRFEPVLLKSMGFFYLAKLYLSCRFITLYLCFISMGILES